LSDNVLVDTVDGVQRIRLNRPDKKNALTREMYGALADALSAANKANDVSVTVLLGAPGVFSAGNDISDFLADAQGNDSLGGDVLRFLDALVDCEKPLIAAVDGLAVGVGTTLLFHCDLVYATPGAVFATPFLDLGLVPEAGSSILMPRRLGDARAFELLVLGERFDAERMAEAGLVNKIMEPGELEATAIASATQLAAKPPEALTMSKQLLRGDKASLKAAMAAEVEAFKVRMKSPEAVEAFTAFMEKRPADFRKTGQ